MHIPASCLEAILELSTRLDWLERQSGPQIADEYQIVVGRLKRMLGVGLPKYVLDPVLDAHPAAAELYENLTYSQLGLSRSPLQVAIGSAIVSIQVLEQFRSRRAPHLNG